MNLKQIEKIAQLITSNFPGKQKAFLFGSFARRLEGERNIFSDPQDLDLLFEVSRDVFDRYCQACMRGEFTIFGQPYDPYSMYWEYYSPALKRWEIIQGIFDTSDSLAKEIVGELGGKSVDIIILPFEWEKDDEILNAINSRDPKFSQNIQGDRKLLFEK